MYLVSCTLDLSLGSLEVPTFSRIDTHQLSLPNERGNLNHDACFQGGRLGGVACGCSFELRFGLDHLQLHRGRHLETNWLTIEELDVDGRPLFEKVPTVSEGLFIKRDLLVVFRIHEVEKGTITVKKLHLPLIESGPFDLFSRTVSMLVGSSTLELSHQDSNKGGTLARISMMLVEYPMRLSLVNDDHPFTNLNRADHKPIR